MSVVTFPIETYKIFYTLITENKNANRDTIYIIPKLETTGH